MAGSIHRRGGIHGAADVFEALSAAFPHVVQRQALAKTTPSGGFASPGGSGGGGGGGGQGGRRVRWLGRAEECTCEFDRCTCAIQTHS